jgi:hypothetical protein
LAQYLATHHFRKEIKEEYPITEDLKKRDPKETFSTTSKHIYHSYCTKFRPHLKSADSIGISDQKLTKLE